MGVFSALVAFVLTEMVVVVVVVVKVVVTDGDCGVME